MRKISHGAANISGINAQTWAAFSLFLQYSYVSDFITIELEKPELADFVLVFKDKRIICESKKYRITYAKIRQILETIPQIGNTDEILIICESLDPNIPKQIEYAQYVPMIAKDLAKRKHFSARILGYLPKLRFRQVGKEFDKKAVKALLLQRLGTWVPDDGLEELLSSLLITKIYEQSAKGGEYSRVTFTEDIEAYKKRLIERDDHLAAKRTADQEARKLLTEVLQFADSRLQSDSRLSALVAQPRYHYFALGHLKERNSLPIEQLDRFWQATFGSYYAREVFAILKEKVTDVDSAKYVITFVRKNAAQIRYQVFDEYHYKEAVDLLNRALAFAPDTEEQVAELLICFYNDASGTPFYFAQRNAASEEWAMEKIATSIFTLYRASSNPKIQQLIIQFILNTINLVEAMSIRHNGKTYPFLEVLLCHVEGDAQRLQDVGDEITRHYDAACKRYSSRAPAFRGWDTFGGIESNFGGTYNISDSLFVSNLLIPGIASLNEGARWEFVLSHVIRQAEGVSRDNPDFYNRAAIPTLLAEFSGGKHEQESLAILADLIRMRRGVPHKADLIYHFALDAPLSAEKKWQILKIGLEEYGYPISVFMDQLLWQLFAQNHAPAIALFCSLLDSAEYMSRQTRFDITIGQSLIKLIENEETFAQGVNLLKKYLDSDYFRIHLDSSDAFDLKNCFDAVQAKDPALRIVLLNTLIASQPTRNEQSAFAAAISDTPESSVLDVYVQIIAPLLARYQTSNALSQVLNPETREEIVWLGEKLAKSHRHIEALRIAEFFSNDPCPAENSECDRGILNGKRDLSITTPRGIVPWILVRTCVTTGQPFIVTVVSLVEKLCNDPSVYVRVQALFALAGLADIRQCKLPEKGQWFMEYPMVQRIEALPFAMLNEPRNHYPAVLRRLANVFVRMRSMGEIQALDIINRFEQFDDDELLDDLASFILFMAEFREHAFEQWHRDRPGLAEFNPEPMKRKLEQLLVSGTEKVRRALTWHLCTLPGDMSSGADVFERRFNISNRNLKTVTERYDHQSFQSVYMFIEKYAEERFDDCYSLWRKCLEVELPVILEASRKKETSDYSWWPYFDNDKMLLKVVKTKGAEQFVNDLELLLDYPIDVNICGNITQVVEALATLPEPREQIQKAFARLIERNPVHLFQYEIWRDNSGNV